ncbi:ubiquitin-conjugating enzyme E2 G1 [Microdochium nivale]|nr:ubiquitin-conjugating enzyme E2 G1 [Microdochium nivale]
MASSSAQSAGAARLLQNQLREIQKADDLPGISVGLVSDSNMFEWEVVLMINDETKYYGGAYFRARLSFPPEYPILPPKMRFLRPVPFHPNIYQGGPQDGELCISILHAPGEDKWGYESAAERWNPMQGPASILMSVISLFSEPNDESPANLDAAKLLRIEREGGAKDFRKMVRKCVRESLGED